MGTGDYMCVTLRGGAPWGFTLREGEGDTYTPFLVSQVEVGGQAFLAGVREGDEVVSLNGEPCADLTLLRAFALLDTSIDSLQLLLKRCCSSPPGEESESTYYGERDSSSENLESTTLHIFSPKHRSQSPRELYISEVQDKAYGNPEFSKKPQLLSTHLHAPSAGAHRGPEPAFHRNNDEVPRCFSPGGMVELQVSFSEQTLDKNVVCTSLGSAHGLEGPCSNREATETVHTSTASHYVPCCVREPLGQHGVVLSSPSMLGQVEVILQQPAASVAGRGILSVGGPRVSGSVGSQSEGEEGGGGPGEGAPGCFSVAFGIPSGEETPGEEQGSESEGDQDKPNKHRAKHSRLRRSESLSEKQVKEAKSKCKRIALLLTAAPPNPNNKGVLMFKKHRQRAKKYTLVSYGTGEEEPEFSDEEDEDNQEDEQETHAVEFALVASNDSELEKHLLTNAHSSKGVVTINWDKGLLEIERSLNDQAKMDCLPETKGKGALMFVQRRQRMDEISAEHEELRRQGIPVDAIHEAEKKKEEHTYMQSSTEDHAYMDVNIHQQSQHQQQYQQYQGQQFYEQQPPYQQQQQYQQQYQQQQYEQQHYQQQQMYQQQQQYHQEQQQMQHYSANINGTTQHQTNEMQSSLSNRTAKPFSVQNMEATPYSPAISGTNQDAMGQGEQIASRDERISTPAIKTSFLLDARKRNVGKPMFTFKEAPKVSPNPELLNLLNRNDKKLGFESGPEEDYLSLGAEACNFLQSQRLKHKNPPPVAPKPVINPNSPPWSPQIEVTNQNMPQCAENSVSTPAVAPTAETTPAPELEPTPAPAPEPSPPPALQEASASTAKEEQHTWTHPDPESQQQQMTTQETNGHINSTPQPETATVNSWAPAQTKNQQQPSTVAWHPAQVQLQEPPPSQSPPQLPWVTRQPPQTQVQPQPPTNTWTPQIQTSWNQSQEQPQTQTHAQPPWAQPREQPQPPPQVTPHWTHSHEQPHMQQMQPTWGQPQEPMQQQPQAPWAQPPQADTQHQPPWVQQSQQKSQPQPPWVQPSQHQAPQQTWPQAQAPGQAQPPWVSAQPQPQPQPQPQRQPHPQPQPQPQHQPPWIQPAQAQPPAHPAANLNPWAPVPAQVQSQPLWAQQPPEHGQHPMNSWGSEQNQAQHPSPWGQSGPPQPTPQPNWQQPTLKTQSQSPVPPAQTQPQTPLNAWTTQSQQSPVKFATSMANMPSSPKPWLPTQNAPPNRSPPTPPMRMNSFTLSQRSSSPINPMAMVLNPPSAGPAYEMLAVRGKGADMFAKRQSRMEKFVVDSETVQANKESRSASPVSSLPNEWKYTPNVRAPPSRSYNPIQSPSYPPAATKQPPPDSSSTKAKKKGKDKKGPAPKPLNVVEVMKHQPYQLNSSLFVYGPAAEAAKSAAPEPNCSPPNPPIDNQAYTYEQMAPGQPAGPSYNAPYPQQPYGMPMQPVVHDGHFQQNPANMYPPANPYQQPPGGPYQQAYNQQYQQPVPSAYQPQTHQSSSPPYQLSQVPYQTANSPPYLAAPSAPCQPPSTFVAPNFSITARPDSAAGGNIVAAPKPKFMAKKSSAQALGRSYSLSPPARVPSKKLASAYSATKPPARASSAPPARQASWMGQGHKSVSPWEAASRHPLGLVDEAFAFQNLQQTLASNIHLAAQRKVLPEPPAEWTARVAYQAPQRAGGHSHTWSRSHSGSQSRAPLPSFASPTQGASSTPAGYRSLPRQWQPHRPVAEANAGPSVSSYEYKKPSVKQSYKSVYSNTTWSWKR